MEDLFCTILSLINVVHAYLSGRQSKLQLVDKKSTMHVNNNNNKYISIALLPYACSKALRR